MADFKVGELVTICDGATPISIQKIEKTTHAGRRLVLSGGGAWYSNGRKQWGANNFSRSHLVPFEESHRDAIKRRNLIAELVRVAWKDVSTEGLLTVLEIVKNSPSKE